MFLPRDKTAVEIVRIAGHTLGLFNLAPGWRWSRCTHPLVRAPDDKPEVAYALSGRIAIRSNDGSQKTVVSGMKYALAPDQEAWVVGDQCFVGIKAVAPVPARVIPFARNRLVSR